VESLQDGDDSTASGLALRACQACARSRSTCARGIESAPWLRPLDVLDAHAGCSSMAPSSLECRASATSAVP
jgi:hypothetical protein